MDPIQELLNDATLSQDEKQLALNLLWLMSRDEAENRLPEVRRIVSDSLRPRVSRK